MRNVPLKPYQREALAAVGVTGDSLIDDFFDWWDALCETYSDAVLFDLARREAMNGNRFAMAIASLEFTRSDEEREAAATGGNDGEAR